MGNAGRAQMDSSDNAARLKRELKMPHAIGVIPFLMAIGPLLAPADQLPAYCGAVGAKSYTPPAVTIPAVVLNRGTVITVTNVTGAVNGDTSSVAALLANPGPDGISLIEAITATNNSPGTWNIQFAPALKGSTILGGMPYLGGGNVTLNGDIDGDGRPDITLTSTIFIISGGNTVNGLTLQNGAYVQIQRPSSKFGLPAATNTTFSGITISNLVLTGIQNEGIVLNPVQLESGAMPWDPALVTGNTWDHILVTGNTISGNTITGSVSGPQVGIDFSVGNTIGDTLQHITIANNNITIQVPGAAAGGIAVGVGSGLGAMNNQALDTLIANNTISAAPGAFGIRIAAGVGSGSANLIDGMQVIGNQVVLIDQTASASELGGGINVAVGDGASDDGNPSLRPIQYSENNIARNISILSNTIGESGNFGINAAVACCGNGNNTIDKLSILGNTMTGLELIGGASGGYYSRPSTGNMLSNVLVQANTIHSSPLPPSPYPPTLEQAITEGGGIYVITGLWEPGNSVIGISIANNDVNTQMIGINVVGGLGLPPPPASGFSADKNIVSAAQIFCNQIDQLPTNGLAAPSGFSGITVAAGVDAATGNQVQQLSVHDNLVAGVLGNDSVFASVGSGAAGNTISILLPSGLVNGPQIAGLVNAATFQQRALAPGSLVSLFGMNLSGATVQFSGVPAPILYASTSQLNLQVPWELQGMSNSTVTVTANSISTDLEPVPVGPADPGIFSFGAPNGGQGTIVNLAGIVVDANSPAHAGDYLEIFCTGLGAVSNTPQTGAVAGVNPVSTLISNLTATIGGVSAPVSFAGLAPGFFGLYQVNVQVPQGVAAGDGVPVIVSIGTTASNTVAISVR